MYEPPTRRQKLLRFLGLVLLAALLCALLWQPLLRLAAQPEHIRQWVDTYGAGGKLAFVLLVCTQVVLAVIPGEPLEICAGYVFGAPEGTLLCLLGIVLGSAITLHITRRLGTRFAGLFFPPEKLQSLSFLQNAQRRNVLLFLLNFLPGTPKDLLSYCAGLTGISTRQWLLLVAVARIPSVVSSTLGGDALGVQNYRSALLVFGVSLLISGLGLLLYRHICRVHR